MSAAIRIFVLGQALPGCAGRRRCASLPDGRAEAMTDAQCASDLEDYLKAEIPELAGADPGDPWGPAGEAEGGSGP